MDLELDNDLDNDPFLVSFRWCGAQKQLQTNQDVIGEQYMQIRVGKIFVCSQDIDDFFAEAVSIGKAEDATVARQTPGSDLPLVLLCARAKA